MNTKVCSKCKEIKLQDLFSPKSSWCKLCKRDLERSRRLSLGSTPKTFSVLENDNKQCMICKSLVPLDQFSPSRRGLGGVSSYCKTCTNSKPKNKESSRANTKKYREVNRERYLSNHRITQYNRKSKLKAVCDGTITDEFLKLLYDTEYCSYCEKYVDRANRTLDHIKALNAGGLHSANNLTMACFSCNSSKQDEDVETFLNRIKQ